MSGGIGMLSFTTVTPPSAGVVRCATSAKLARISPRCTSRVTFSRLPGTHCWARTPAAPAPNSRRAAAKASVSLTTSTASRRWPLLVAHDRVGLSTAGYPISPRTSGTRAVVSSSRVTGYAMPRLRATLKVRSLSFAACSASSEAKASRQPSASSSPRRVESAAIEPSVAGSRTRVGCRRTKSTTASANASAPVA